ncbi:molybdenum cofactor guanylyltransferase [Roseateles terrae]|uniref:Molybdenum cofactor guanylyltransferase n=1 Tax=Roseateles terrae TaxID=431060 RepID=A0ABR6GPM2_9BURK|nr:molybdenum cofactor guanylyltransferase [Roseateles terrae]MBB3194036.1 molybdopterin-guanine dinucleotide biosynthesis protein A [Roseateles terrae]OWQ87906.1 hypothetical protein CDN98_07030 [Roseateles terrae]
MMSADRVTALILCGGRGSRMGGVDKPLEVFQGRPLVQHVLDRMAPQVGGRVLISANRHHEVYAALGYPVVADGLSDFQGPLAGMLAGMEAVSRAGGRLSGGLNDSQAGGQTEGLACEPADHSGDHWLLCVSGDSPWLPKDLLSRLMAALTRPGTGSGTFPDALPVTAQAAASLDSAMAWGREAPGTPLRSQPLASVIHTRHQASLRQALMDGERRVEAWLRTLPLAEVAFDRPEDDHAFANINDRSQLERPYPAP